MLFSFVHSENEWVYQFKRTCTQFDKKTYQKYFVKATLRLDIKKTLIMDQSLISNYNLQQCIEIKKILGINT